MHVTWSSHTHESETLPSHPTSFSQGGDQMTISLTTPWTLVLNCPGPGMGLWRHCLWRHNQLMAKASRPRKDTSSFVQSLGLSPQVLVRELSSSWSWQAGRGWGLFKGSLVPRTDQGHQQWCLYVRCLTAGAEWGSVPRLGGSSWREVELALD